MRIAEFAAASGVTAHTLRYYEKIGLLPAIARDAGGRRVFDAKDLDWIAFVTRLKDTGMPLAQIREYARLRDQGEGTARQRRQILETHADALADELARSRDHLDRIHDKISWYAGLESGL